jgi:hypothetical protein
MAGFWVQRIGDMVQSPDTQMLQPMHSRIADSSPSATLLGRKGSAIEGRAAPMKSSTPCRTIRRIVAGEVNLPTPTTGLEVCSLSPATYAS